MILTRQNCLRHNFDSAVWEEQQIVEADVVERVLLLFAVPDVLDQHVDQVPKIGLMEVPA